MVDNLVADMRANIKLAIEAITPLQVFWKGQALDYIGEENAFFEIRPRTVESIGLDADRKEEAGELLQVVRVGARRITLEITCTSYDQEDDQVSMQELDKLRIDLKTAESRERLKATCLSVLSIGPMLHADVITDHQLSSVAVCEVIFYSPVRREYAPVDQFVETIETTSQIEDGGGEILPEPPNVTDLVLP